MNQAIMKPADAQALVREMSNDITRRVDALRAGIDQSAQMSPVQMQEMIVRITGALEGIAMGQRQILQALEAQGSNNICR